LPGFHRERERSHLFLGYNHFQISAAHPVVEIHVTPSTSSVNAYAFSGQPVPTVWSGSRFTKQSVAAAVLIGFSFLLMTLKAF
jgi:hypothetical protein